MKRLMFFLSQSGLSKLLCETVYSVRNTPYKPNGFLSIFMCIKVELCSWQVGPIRWQKIFGNFHNSWPSSVCSIFSNSLFTSLFNYRKDYAFNFNTHKKIKLKVFAIGAVEYYWFELEFKLFQLQTERCNFSLILFMGWILNCLFDERFTQYQPLMFY